jgi:hypothetical protein
MDREKILLGKPLGEILAMASLISPYQIQVALMDQQQYGNMKIGEILVLRGWLKQSTIDFFADQFPILLKNNVNKKIGEYLKLAGLLEDIQIKDVLLIQKRIGFKFGSITVLRGWLKQETIDFFIHCFFQANKGDSFSIYSEETFYDDSFSIESEETLY